MGLTADSSNKLPGTLLVQTRGPRLENHCCPGLPLPNKPTPLRTKELVF